MRHFFQVFALLSLSSASTALAEMHTYSIARIAQTEARCQEAESRIVDKFARLAEATVLSHGCEMNTSHTFDLVIEYAKPTAANLVTTFDEFDYVQGLYDSADECVAHYKEDKVTFLNQTGLEPLFAYCFQDPRANDRDGSWIMRIDGFGMPKNFPQHMSKDFYYAMNGDLNDIGRQLKEALTAFGAADVKVKIKSNNGRSSFHALYYADHKVPMFQYADGQYTSMQVCESYRDQMREVFARADGQSALYFCGQDPYSLKVHGFSAGLVLQPLASEVASVKYRSFDACEAKRAETELAWRGVLNRNIVGSICAMEYDLLDSDVVRMRVFWLD